MKCMIHVHTSVKFLLIDAVCITLCYSALYALLPKLRGTDVGVLLAYLVVLLPAFVSIYPLLKPFNAFNVFKFLFWYWLLTILNFVIFFRIFIN